MDTFTVCEMQNNYFVCTLGQAVGVNDRPKPYRTTSEFISQQAHRNPSLPAVGFLVPRPDEKKWGHNILTFENVDQGASVFAERILRVLGKTEKPHTIALLCHSSPEFLFVWLALMKLGHSVLLIAPQCQPAAILHLYKSCNAFAFFYDTAHQERARQTESFAQERGLGSLGIHVLPLYEGEDIFQVIRETVEVGIDIPKMDETAVAYLHHTSGTSSGLPKPIPQSHRAAIGVLPQLPKTPGVASFTTTPLYHGGIADLFRCWTSNALIWLFPSKDVPTTARTICMCLDTAKSYSSVIGLPQIKYFSSVPYILQLMEADVKGVEHLQQMDIVGVGGAALPEEVGNRLVKQGVRLISRFGSSECGFILSSYRDFTEDNDWQYLRNNNPSKLLSFEQGENSLAELIIKPGWPHMAKQNRPDGSFATSDLFAPHPEKQDTWLYHSRADSQLALITGKKFDPAPLEAAIATSLHLDDVLIFGNNKPFPGALLLRSAQSSDVSDQDLLDEIEPMVVKLNRESQDHARIPLNMLKLMPHQSQPLEKSSKGTIIRKAAESRFGEVIERAYSSQQTKKDQEVEDKDLTQHLTNLVQSITSQSDDLTEDMDLFAYGVDSIACMRLRTCLAALIPNGKGQLPMSVVEDCGSIRRLTRYIVGQRHGERDISQEGDDGQQMLDLVKQFGTWEQCSPNIAINGSHTREKVRQVVILTGATGALGVYILDLLQKTANIETIYCLVRGADEHAARERVSKALLQKGLANLPPLDKLNGKVKVIPAQLGEERLGLSDELYDRLAKTTTSIMHIAWTVNFRLKLPSFVKDNIAGVRNLLNLALKVRRANPPRFTYCSSTAAIMNHPVNESEHLPERVSSDPSSASPLGYSRSKWVAEQICLEAHRRTSLRGRIAVVRVGQLSGDSTSGVWNTKEAWPMMLSTAGLIHCLPDLGDEPLDWLPVDIAAQAFLETTGIECDNQGEMPAYHVLNPHQHPTWREMLGWLRKESDIEIVPPAEWVRRLEASEKTDHSAIKLLGLWKESYGTGNEEPVPRPEFSMVETKQHVLALQGVRPLDEAYVRKMWEWVQKSVY